MPLSFGASSVRARFGGVIRVSLLVGWTAWATAAGCTCEPNEVQQTSTGGAGQSTGAGASSAGGNGSGGGSVQCTETCGDARVCSHGVCVPLIPCSDDDDCKNDAYCDPAVGCLPWQDA